MQVTDDEIAEAIHACRGIKSSICKRLGISAPVLTKRINNSEDLLKVVADTEEKMNDFVESKLFRAIEDGHAWAIRLYVTTKLQHRGYTAKLKVDANVEKTGRVTIIRLPDNGRGGHTSGASGDGDND